MNRNELKKILKKFPLLFLGFLFISLGTVMMIYANLGLNPWGILYKGVSIQSRLTFGQVSQLTGLTLIIISVFLGISPGLATIFNMYFIGLFIDIIDNSSLLFTPSSFIGKLLLLLGGIFVLCLGIYYYLSCGLGAGPIDGLTLGLSKKLRLRISIVRTTMDIVATITGFLLGGPLGIGTVIIAISTGYTLQAIFSIARFNPNNTNQLNLVDLHRLLFKTKENHKTF